MKKYTLTNETIEIDGHTLYRIQALIDISQIGVKTGDLGGYIESESNLSQKGNCWIFKDAKVYENAKVYGDAQIYGYAEIYGDARIYGNVEIFGYARIYGYAWVCENAYIFGHALVHGNAIIHGTARICENAEIFGHSIIFGAAKIKNNAIIESTDDYIVIGPMGSREDCTTFYRTKDNGVWVACGCFNGSIEDFRTAVYYRHANSILAEDYYFASSFAQSYLDRRTQK